MIDFRVAKQRHRGPHPQDAELFAERQWEALRNAVADFSWLLGRGYAHDSALKLVGDRFQLTARQRTAVSRASCSDSQRESRQKGKLAKAELAGKALLLDGFNVLTTVEAALGGGVILRCRDGCFRDMALKTPPKRLNESAKRLPSWGRRKSFGIWTNRSPTAAV